MNDTPTPVPSLRIEHPAHMAVSVIKHVRAVLGLDLVTAKGVVCDGKSTKLPLVGDERRAFLVGLENLGARFFVSENGDWVLVADTKPVPLYFHKRWMGSLLWSTSKADAAVMFKDVAEMALADTKLRFNPELSEVVRLEPA